MTTEGARHRAWKGPLLFARPASTPLTQLVCIHRRPLPLPSQPLTLTHPFPLTKPGRTPCCCSNMCAQVQQDRNPVLLQDFSFVRASSVHHLHHMHQPDQPARTKPTSSDGLHAFGLGGRPTAQTSFPRLSHDTGPRHTKECCRECVVWKKLFLVYLSPPPWTTLALLIYLRQRPVWPPGQPLAPARLQPRAAPNVHTHSGHSPPRPSRARGTLPSRTAPSAPASSVPHALAPPRHPGSGSPPRQQPSQCSPTPAHLVVSSGHCLPRQGCGRPCHVRRGPCIRPQFIPIRNSSD